MDVTLPSDVEAFSSKVKAAGLTFDYVFQNSGIVDWGANVKGIGELTEYDLGAFALEFQVDGLSAIRVLNSLVAHDVLARNTAN